MLIILNSSNYVKKMKISHKNIIYIILFFFYLQKETSSTGLRCNQIIDNDAFFSLEPLSSSTDYQYTYTMNGKSYTLYYNFCKFTERACKSISSYAVIFPLDEHQQEINESCIHLTSDKILSNYEYSLTNQDDPSNGIQLNLTGGDEFNNTIDYAISFKIYCDKSSLPTKFILDELIQDINEFVAIGRSNQGCPLVQISEVYKFILDNKYFFGILSIIIGIVECFFGLAVLKPSLFLIGYISAFGFLILVFGEFIMTPDLNILLVWMLLLIAVLIGAIAGYVATSLPKVGFMGLGLWFGFILAFILNNLFLYKIEVDPPGLILYIVMGILGVIFAILSMYVWRHLCILATSFLGSYLVIRSLSLYIGHYPNELSLNLEIKYKELASVGWEFYVYFICILALTVVGAFVQYRNKKKIGGKFAGEFDSVEDIEEIGENYVEMDNMNKKICSIIKEEKDEDTENSKNTHIFKEIKKNDDIEGKTRKSDITFSFSQEKEIVPQKKSFQGPTNKNLNKREEMELFKFKEKSTDQKHEESKETE